MIGDTITVLPAPTHTSLSSPAVPKYFINAFGEELIMDDAEKGLAYACEKTGARIPESHSPVYMDSNAKSAHRGSSSSLRNQPTWMSCPPARYRSSQEINSEL